jgi:hypothetical protein
MASQVAVQLALRKLWSDHVIWTREYIVAAVAGTPDADAAAGRLLRNQEDIGGAIVPYYGDGAGKALTDLLKQHIMIAVDLIAAAKAGDDERFKTNDTKWDDNAHEIAKFLSGANPNWPEAAVYDLLDQHLRLTKGEVVARLKKDWAADVKAFDDIFTEIVVVADTLANGLAKQFPAKFTA